MRVLIVTEYVRRFAWSLPRWSADLAAALRARGHDASVACDNVEDPSFFTGVPLLVRRPHRTWRGADPAGFQSWAVDLSERGGFDATISLTPLVPGDLWAPVSLTSTALFGHLVRTHSPVSAAFEIAARPWLPLAALAEARARASSRPGGARPVMGRLGRLSGAGAAVPLGFASRLEPFEEPARAAARHAVRSLLGLSPERAAIQVSAVHPHRRGFAEFLSGFMLARADLGDHAPVLLVMGRRVIPVHRAAHRAGAARFVRFLGGTARPELAFGAADLAAAPWAAHGSIGTGRFIADALRLGIPVTAHPLAPGAELIRPEHFGTPEVGMIVDRPDAEGWRRAIVRYLSLERWPYATRAARDAGAVLSLDGMAARVEHALHRIADA